MWRGIKVTQEVYIVKNLKEPLLGRPAVEALGMLRWIEEVGITGPRRVAIPLQPKLKQEFDRLLMMGIIFPVDCPTEWCSGIVIVPKPNGQIKLRVDLTRLYNSVKREHMTIPTFEESLAHLQNARMFSKLDSRLLTTFITPFGRFCCNRLPFGITSAPEFYQRDMSCILADNPNVICIMDDILSPEKIEAAGITLNDKSVFAKSRVKFLGHTVSNKEIEAHPAKIEAIQEMTRPQSIKNVRTILGMVNYVGKFAPKLASVTEPLGQLLRKVNEFVCGQPQETSFKCIKELMCARQRSYWSRCIVWNSSSPGIAVVLEQPDDNGNWKSVVYASRSLSETERKHAQIEKEELTITLACDRSTTLSVHSRQAECRRTATQTAEI
ncbi:hypothetical protein PR048_008332 [Dryococelus australis]|uniref:Reverse transcriptase/retrotransposon-derived protein RNase H-like domain-containing protein n=1 Tax=Dryococelus australis TaxID=614101 RepID=A0ABQ9HWU0_9NEOP|nr:hypothetical protein PR048_008332 [Dryococelus australis]